MMTYRPAITIAIALLASLVNADKANAQLHPTQQKDGYVKTLFNKTDSVAVYTELMANSPSEFGSSVPRFAVIGKDRTFYIGIGGYIKATVSYDFGNPLDNPNEFFTSQIPAERRPGDGGKIQFSAQQTSLFLNFVGLPGSDNQIGAFIGANLLGDGYAPALQYAYLKYRGITAGYDKTLFSDPAATPPTIDYEGPNASTAIGNATVNYQLSFGKKKEWKFGVGVELPMTSVTDNGELAYKVNQRVPDVPAYIQYSWGDQSSWVRASGIVRNMLYHDARRGKNIDRVGWGVQLSGVIAPVSGLTIYYQGVYGEGIASYIQDMTDCGMDLLPSVSNENSLKRTRSWGAYAGVQYDFSSKVFASATYSHVRNYADGCRVPDGEGQYRYAQYVDANIFWNITNIFQAGLEYIYGRRVNFDASQGHDSRLQLALQLSF